VQGLSGPGRPGIRRIRAVPAGWKTPSARCGSWDRVISAAMLAAEPRALPYAFASHFRAPKFAESRRCRIYRSRFQNPPSSLTAPTRWVGVNIIAAGS